MNQEPVEGSIVVCPDGPLLVRGDFEIVTPSGEPVPRERRTVALCRCGASAIKPYCDGTHKMIKFRTEPPTGPRLTETTQRREGQPEDATSGQLVEEHEER